MLESLDTPAGRWALALCTGAASAIVVTIVYVLLIKVAYRLTLRHTVAREFLRQCDKPGAVVVFFLTLLMPFFNALKRFLHDYLCGTVVVRR